MSDEFRTRDVRPAQPTDVQRAGLQAWFGSLDRHKIEDVETKARSAHRMMSGSDVGVRLRTAY